MKNGHEVHKLKFMNRMDETVQDFQSSEEPNSMSKALLNPKIDESDGKLRTVNCVESRGGFNPDKQFSKNHRYTSQTRVGERRSFFRERDIRERRQCCRRGNITRIVSGDGELGFLGFWVFEFFDFGKWKMNRRDF